MRKFPVRSPAAARAAVGRHAAAAVQQSQHKLHNIPLNSLSQPDLSLISLNKESEFGLLFRVLRYHYGSTKVTHGQISIASILRIFALSMSKSVLNLRVPKSTLKGLKLGASCTTNQNMRPPVPRLPPDFWPRKIGLQ